MEEPTRLVDYFVISGYNHATGKTGTGSHGGFACQGTILQRFPTKDWDDTPFIEGLEHFCQPNGWKLTADREDPKFFISVLTDIKGNSHYCACLAFSEAVSKDLIEDVAKNKTSHDDDEEDVVDSNKSLAATLRGTSLPRHIVPGISLPAMPHDAVLFAPKCLVLISRHDFPEVFRNCLGVIYTVYSECLVGAGGERIKLETMVGNLLGHVYVPRVGGSQVRFSLGGLDKLTLTPPMYPKIPQTGTRVALLFQQLGIRNVLWLVMAALTEQKILFHSESFSRLTDSCTALTALLYPFKYSHVFIPIIPSSLVEVLNNPTPFIMGVHSMHDREINEVMDTIVVDLDGGALTLPENYKIFMVSEPLFSKAQRELALVLKPDLSGADNAFQFYQSSSKKPLALLDKELRAVMLRLMVHILEGYRSCLTMVRIHPKPFITFHKASFLGLRNQCDCQFTQRLLDCMFFNTFVSERGPPWRSTDLFDNLYNSMSELNLIEENDPSRVLRHIQSLGEEFYRNENSTVISNGANAAQKIPQPPEGAMTRIHQPVFPLLQVDLLEDITRQGVEVHLKEVKAFEPSSDLVQKKLVPMGSSRVLNEDSPARTKLPNSARKLEVLRNCIACIFENKIADAKKTFPAVLSALKSRAARLALCEELAMHKSGNQVVVEHQQFDMIVRLMNAALADDSDIDEYGIAATLLPLSSVFGRKLSKGVIQFVYTLIQEHPVWQNPQFWEASFFNDVQKGIKSLYLAMQDYNENAVPSHATSTSCAPAGQQENVNKSRKTVVELAAEEMKRWSMLDDNAKKERITAEEQTVYSHVFDYTNRMICLLCPMELNASKKSGKKVHGGDEYEMAASNSISNSVAESDSIDAESGFEDQEIPDGGQNVIKIVLRFADKVCSESQVTEDHIKTINQMIPSSVAMHLETLEAVVSQAKKLPPIQKAKINVPSLLPGEELITENGLRVYLLDDGRDKALSGGLTLLPAEGALFLTTYRIIFKGTPIDPFAAEHTLTRYFPVSSLTREKRFSLSEFLSEVEQQLKEGIQLRSSTFQLIRAAFDDEVSMEDVENFRKNLQRLRYPENIYHFFAFRGGHHFLMSQENQSKSKDKSKYNTMRVFTKTLKNVSRAAGIKTKANRKHTSKYLLPNVMPAHGRLSMLETHDHHKIYEEDEENNLTDIRTNTLASIVQTSSNSTSKTLERMMDRSYFKDWIRQGLIAPDYNLALNKGQTYSSSMSSEPFRVTTVNHRYSLANTYPALLLVPAKITDESLKRYARLHRQSRFPSITWRHPKNQAILLRGSSFLGKGVMGMIKRHHDGFSQPNHNEVNSTVEAELYITSIIQQTPRAMVRPDSAWNMAGSELSINSLVAPNAGDYPPVHSYPTLTPTMSRKYNNPISRAMDTLTRNTPAPGLSYGAPKRSRISLGSMKGNRQMGSQSSLASANLRSSGSDYYSSQDSSFLQRASLYIFGDKSQMKGAKFESHPKAEFIPIEFPEPRRVRASFKKLMRACVPSASSAQPDQSFMKQVEGSEWVYLLQSLIQLSGAVVDLLDIQGASVMLCLEDGWDISAQVTSLALLCLDPYYRTIEGFRVLIEKEWLAVGHRFNHRSNFSNPNQDSGFTPMFLQFLDAVHQIHHQFPMAFEFNQYYLRFLAYHHVSCRFHNFLCDYEFQRSQVGLLSDVKQGNKSRIIDTHSSDDELGHPQGASNFATPTKSGGGLNGIHKGMNVFDYIDMHASKTPAFHNFIYTLDTQNPILRPFSNISDLRIWDYYLGEELKHGPSYDYELVIADLEQDEELFGNVDSMTSAVSDGRENMIGGYDCVSRNDPDSCSYLLSEIAHLEQELGYLPRGWKYHWQNLEIPPPVPPRETTTSAPIVQTTPSLYAKQHGRTMHKKSTMELILRNKMGSGYPVASGAVDVDPASGTVYSHSHKFEKNNYTTPTSCDVCHSLLWGPRTGLRCIDCGFNVHEKCRDKAPKSCTRFKASAIPKDDTTENFEQFQRDDATPKLRVTNSDNEDMYYGQFARNIDENSQIIYQGYLFKQANFKIKGWKQRWFVLDSTKHQMRYYDTREDFHCKGVIDLSEVTRITEGNNTTPGAPRKSEDKCFFELQTLKRNYCFCAETRQAAHEWVSKIQMCLQ